MEFNENSNRIVINVDVDGVLTNGEKFWDAEPSPNIEAISLVRELYKQGNIIIIHTARMWECAPETIAWLVKHHVPFHGVYMAKGGADMYIDDKQVTIDQLSRLLNNKENDTTHL